MFMVFLDHREQINKSETHQYVGACVSGGPSTLFFHEFGVHFGSFLGEVLVTHRKTIVPERHEKAAPTNGMRVQLSAPRADKRGGRPYKDTSTPPNTL